MKNFYAELQYVARKSHKCAYCGNEITKGSEYMRQKGNFSKKYHNECWKRKTRAEEKKHDNN